MKLIYVLIFNLLFISSTFSQFNPPWYNDPAPILGTYSSDSGAISTNAENALKIFKNEQINRYAEPIIPASGARTTDPNLPKPTDISAIYKLNNYPNPFNNSTIIEATLPEGSTGEIVVNSITGKQIRRIELHEKENKIEIDGNELAPGIYFYTLWVNGEFIAVKKMERTK
ncbi:MAG: hypothetical protein COA97_11180 [Flavobacteriales bacterium]|nr:MAG: hypothetical protein COA97_11180 [Flavobacteriales bacterium]